MDQITFHLPRHFIGQPFDQFDLWDMPDLAQQLSDDPIFVGFPPLAAFMVEPSLFSPLADIEGCPIKPQKSVDIKIYEGYLCVSHPNGPIVLTVRDPASVPMAPLPSSFSQNLPIKSSISGENLA